MSSLRTINSYSYFVLLLIACTDNFAIGEQNGVLRLIRSLDRQITPEVNLTVTAICCGDNTTVTSQINVTVLDVDDNLPVFKGVTPPVTIRLSQEFQSGTSRSLPTATDANSGDNADIQYTGLFLPSDWADYFQVHKDTGELQTIKACDDDCMALFTEGQDLTFQLTLIASNPGVPGNRLSITVVLEYQDTNIHTPVFQNATYVLILPMESAAVGSTLLTVKAEDGDTGQDGQIRYTFAQGTPPRTESTFRVNINSGEVTLKYRLDEDSYKFTLVATDGAVRPKSGQTEVFILVTGKNTGLNSSVTIIVAGCLGGVLLILIIVVIYIIMRMRKLKTKLEEKIVDNDNLKTLLRTFNIPMHSGTRGRPRDEPFDQIDDTADDGYNVVVDSPSVDPDYNDPGQLQAPRHQSYLGSDNIGYVGGTGIRVSDYMTPSGNSMPQNGIVRDDYITPAASPGGVAQRESINMDYMQLHSD